MFFELHFTVLRIIRSKTVMWQLLSLVCKIWSWRRIVLKEGLRTLSISDLQTPDSLTCFSAERTWYDQDLSFGSLISLVGNEWHLANTLSRFLGIERVNGRRLPTQPDRVTRPQVRGWSSEWPELRVVQRWAAELMKSPHLYNHT